MWTFYHRDTADSTNSWAKDVALENPQLNYGVFTAKIQTQGRGRHGRFWWSPDGGLWVSLLLRPKRLVPLSLVVGLWCAEVLQSLGVPAKIRWPNDLYIEEDKLGGVLVESVSLGGEKSFGIVGLGLNIEVTGHDNIPPLEHSWTGCQRYVSDFDSSLFLERWLTKVAQELPKFEDAGWPIFQSRYHQLDDLVGRSVLIKQGVEEIQGVVKGTGEVGELVLDSGASFWNVDRVWVQ